ncbi:MAG: 50S ribosomal protein L21 [Rhodothermales bacterium]|nr:50S ribosomal protein L21 [Rhodothermales bacterium]
MYAIVDIAGKQYKVRENDRLYIPRQQTEIDKKIKFDKVLLIGNDDKVKVGKPVVKGASVTAQVLDHVKGDKVIVFKKKRRKGYRVKNGHRQPFTQIEVQSIKAGR